MSVADVRLRPLSREDLPRLHGWYQTRELWEHLVGGLTRRPEPDAIAYMARWLVPSETELRLGIEVDEEFLAAHPVIDGPAYV